MTSGQPGRPKLPPADLRSAQINIRLTSQQLADLEADASLEGLHVWELVRARALGKSAQVRKTVPALNREAWLELARTSANLNQLTAFLHGALPSGPDAEITLAQLRTEVAEVRRLLIGAA